ncbi:MAG: 50S ribosomal protein L9 [Cyclobacteriaceae bacterium]
MEIILKEDIGGLGYKYDIVKVKAGYGRNYLIPQGLAVVANNSNKKMIEEIVKQASHKAEKLQQDAEALAQSIGDLALQISAKAGESGKIFGAVTTLQISDALKEKGFDIDRKRITFNSEVKHLGNFEAILDLHREIKHKLAFKVVEA